MGRSLVLLTKPTESKAPLVGLMYKNGVVLQVTSVVLGLAAQVEESEV